MSPDLLKLDGELTGLGFLCELVLRQRDNLQLQLCLVERLLADRTPLKSAIGLGRTVDYLVLSASAAAEAVQLQSARGGGEAFFGAVATLRHELIAVGCEIALMRGDAEA